MPPRPDRPHCRDCIFFRNTPRQSGTFAGVCEVEPPNHRAQEEPQPPVHGNDGCGRYFDFDGLDFNAKINEP